MSSPTEDIGDIDDLVIDFVERKEEASKLFSLQSRTFYIIAVQSIENLTKSLCKSQLQFIIYC